MAFSEYDTFDAVGLAALVRAGEVSPRELLDEAIARADALDPRLNAIVTRLDDRARERLAVAPPEGPLAGVPFLLKDLGHALAGAPLTRGSAAGRRFVPRHDAEIVRRFHAAGLMTFGKTNVPELGLLGVTEPAAFGPTRNPWDPERSSGGSSGGSAAAVAARIVPMASASDGGGSIRIPAAWCGLVGLKPSRGRVPQGPTDLEAWAGAVVDGVLARSVRDVATALDVIAGPEPGSPFVIAPPVRPYAIAITDYPEGLRVAFSTRHPLGHTVHPDAVRAVERTARRLEALGHHVEPAEPDVDYEALVASYLTMYFGVAAATLAEWEAEQGRSLAAELEPATRLLAAIGRALPAGEYVAARHRWSTFARQVDDLFTRFDLYLTPTTAEEPPAIGALQPAGAERLALQVAAALPLGGLLRATGLVERLAAENLRPVPFTQLANLTGRPALSLPLYRSPSGLPFGVHFLAPFGREDVLLRLAAQFEAAHPWADARPPLLD